jgi:hypothetical protein
VSSSIFSQRQAGKNLPRRAVSAAGTLCLLAACHPATAPSADAGSVLHTATWTNPAPPELAGFREALRTGKPAGVLSIGIDQAGNVVHLGAAGGQEAPRTPAGAAESARSPGCA